ncbi:hypothetical protein N7474_001605 [Penicillium riverlandense]|uniref:uncharacterized protein n=1 Tax=Penicillium riverlandense TaxID=1903569 RepID=UPI002548D2FB|nr:uncharacterized protein N7474_001605 [Penicillium riverlandense]KAJ5833294.1 hypothetical protein N7474_001605 [Penicillium riverlandense]
MQEYSRPESPNATLIHVGSMMISVDGVVRPFLPGISRQVVEAFEKDEWSIADFESLPLAGTEGKYGTYILFAADLYERRTLHMSAAALTCFYAMTSLPLKPWNIQFPSTSIEEMQ